jgi:hypothetical protein
MSRQNNRPKRSLFAQPIPCGPLHRHSCPFVSIRGSSPPPSTVIRVHSCRFVVPTHTPHEPPTGQISGWKARATFNGAHSCRFVVQPTPRATFIRVPSWFNPTPRATFIRAHSCRFVVKNAPQPPSFVPICVDSWLKTPLSYLYSCQFVSIRGSNPPPELPSFVPIRVDSWFKTAPHPPSFVSIRG